MLGERENGYFLLLCSRSFAALQEDKKRSGGMSALMAKLVRRVTSNDEINGSNPFQSIGKVLFFLIGPGLGRDWVPGFVRKVGVMLVSWFGCMAGGPEH